MADSYFEDLLLVAKLSVLLVLQLFQRDPVTIVVNQLVVAFDDGLADHLHECLHFCQGSNDRCLQFVLRKVAKDIKQQPTGGELDRPTRF